MSSPGLTKQSRIPTTGMRGGLGRTLLTAFLILAILPLSTITWYATQRERKDIQREVTAKLSSVAKIMETQIQQWIEYQSGQLTLLAALPSTREGVETLIHAENVNPSSPSLQDAHDALETQIQILLAQNPAFQHLSILDAQGQILISIDAADVPNTITGVPGLAPAEQANCPYPDAAQSAHRTNLIITQSIDKMISGSSVPLARLTGWLNPCALVAKMEAASDLGETGEIYLVDDHKMILSQGQVAASPGIEAALSSENNNAPVEGLYENYAGVPVIGVYRWMPELRLILVAEQTQEEAFASNNNVIAAVVGATLGVALLTAVIAAVVTRQITRPIVQLTETALSIAEGDMEKRVPVTSRDEIGILAYVFNRMTSELKALYDDLEEKVAQRTALLQKANYQIQQRAIQLATTLEVSQAATSILDPDQLLKEVVRLVHDSFFAYVYVGIYLFEVDDEGNVVEDNHWVQLQASRGGRKEMKQIKAQPVHLGGERTASIRAISQAATTGEPHIEKWTVEEAEHLFFSPYIRAEAALPLKMGDQVIGVLDILSTEEQDFDTDDVSVLKNVANQITTALANARTYAMEREASKRLRELDRSKRRFLVNMSHELRTPLTNIIGFSRLMLKGIEGELTPQQRDDVQIIYHNGQHLLGLINDLLDISHIEAGMMALEFHTVNLNDLIQSVMATANALVRGRDIELKQHIVPDLPTIQADAARIRQVLLRLLTNAAKFTHQGSITVQSWVEDGHVVVSVSDTGLGIAPEDHDRIFRRFEQGNLQNGGRPNGAGLGLALSKEFVEMHGGQIWFESELGLGTTFTFTLPVSQNDDTAIAEDQTSDES
ncbi:MAG TPA: HAMP domain-containing protein [Chloroflexi bacterium]|nr:HAMP domain-containing protein [Chloroflexota bacterium]